jgi:hypothetical protein
MNIRLTQKELISLIETVIDDLEFEDELDVETELDEQGDGGGTGVSDDGGGAGTAVMTPWSTNIARGVANQVGVSVNNSTEKLIGRGKANPLW